MTDDTARACSGTGALRQDQLSDDEIIAMAGIEDRLWEARAVELDKELKGPDRYRATVQDRHPRVLLLDGGRGTGKTSLLLTLIERWHQPLARGKTGDGRPRGIPRAGTILSQSEKAEILGHPPHHVTVVDNLDFDPLPPGMPVIAGIVQAWRPLVEALDEREAFDDRPDTGGDKNSGPLLDIWRRLFHMAAVGWTAVPTGEGLIEQVLDREEQVQDWLQFDGQWRGFVDKLIERGRRRPAEQLLDQEPVFVIVIDDCDLQVGRIRELLPAIRLLYHPRVFFLLAADRPHMIDMLKLDYLGQQNKLAHRQIQDNALATAETDRWAGALAQAAVEKVFPLRNRWRLKQLSLRQLLDFPQNTNQPIGQILDGWKQQPQPGEPALGNLGTYLGHMAGEPAESIELPWGWSYRTAQQVRDKVRANEASNQEEEANQPTSDRAAGNDAEQRAAETIGLIIAGADFEDTIRIVPGGPEGAPGPRANPAIEYHSFGRLEAFFPVGFSEGIAEGDIVLSSQPEFRFASAPEDSLEIQTSSTMLAKQTSAIIASSLQADGYGLVAPRLQWDARLYIAWTRIRLPQANLALHWRHHRHPSPLSLLSWAKDWRQFVNRIGSESEERLDRIAYGWIYYHLRWMDGQASFDSLKGIRGPFQQKTISTKAWDSLLSYQLRTGLKRDRDRWRLFTLPLLARPELGLSEEVQMRLLAPVETDQSVRRELRRQRRRLITDAILAAAAESRTKPVRPESEEQVSSLIDELEGIHRDAHGNPSPWAVIVESL